MALFISQIFTPLCVGNTWENVCTDGCGCCHGSWVMGRKRIKGGGEGIGRTWGLKHVYRPVKS
eukprot:1339788-Amorphochlora_amoeboformis.AAC.1